MRDIPKVKPWPERAVQCDFCGGDGCDVCHGRGWVARESGNGRLCAHKGCFVHLRPDQVEVYCSIRCATEDCLMFQTCTVTINAILPRDKLLLEQFLQHIRDFDANHPGCHFSNIASTNLPVVEMEEALSKITPPFQFGAIHHEN